MTFLLKLVLSAILKKVLNFLNKNRKNKACSIETSSKRYYDKYDKIIQQRLDKIACFKDLDKRLRALEGKLGVNNNLKYMTQKTIAVFTKKKYSKPLKKKYLANKIDVYHIDHIWSIDKFDLKSYGSEKKKVIDMF